MSLLWENTGTGAHEYSVYYYMSNEFVTTTSVIGNIITKISVNLKKSGSPTGTITGHLWSNTGNPNAPYATSDNTVDISSLTTSYVNYEFTFIGNSVNAVADSKAGIHFNTLSAAPHLVYVNGSGAFDGAHREVGNTTSWTSALSNCLTMGVYGAATGSTGGRLPPPPIVLGGL